MNKQEDLDNYMQQLSKRPMTNHKSVSLLQKELAQMKKVMDSMSMDT